MANLPRKSLRNYLPACVKQSLKRSYDSLWNFRQSGRVDVYRRDLDAIVGNEGQDREIIIFTPSVQWDIVLFQRPQQLATALSRLGALVFYVDPPLSQRPVGFQRLADRLYVCRVPPATFHRLRSPVVITQAWTNWNLQSLNSAHIVYDYLDELSVFPFNQTVLRRRHKALVRSAHRVLATAQDLYREVEKERPDSLYCPNGVDYDHFASGGTRNRTPPKSTVRRDFLDGKPIIGYYGAIARWFDHVLLRNVARRRRDLRFLLIGVEWDRTLSKSLLLREPNVTYLGPVSYRELPDYLSLFHVAMIPFVLNALTHATSPLKLFEYMAGGKPVVVTPMRECVQYPGVLAAATEEEFSMAIDRALELADDRTYLALIDRVARENTWEARARQILGSPAA
ncbi:MAG: glycosyltransferase [Desulfomonilaceae bacterium]|nr:glycosyltransferase [Desulfomonilaceae bacterium]